MKTISNKHFFPLALGLFLIDISVVPLFEKQFFYLTLALYISLIFHPASGWRLSVLATLIALESFLYYGTFGLDLLYLLPATFIGLQMRSTFYGHTINRYLLVASCILAQNLLVNGYLLQAPSPVPYTFAKTFATMGLMLLFP